MSLVLNTIFITEVANFSFHLASMFLELSFQGIQQTAIIFGIQSFHEFLVLASSKNTNDSISPSLEYFHLRNSWLFVDSMQPGNLK